MHLPADYQAFLALSSEEIQQLCDDLVNRPLDRDKIDQWLEDWATLAALFQECMARFDIAISVNTADEAAHQKATAFRETIWPIGHQLQLQAYERLQTHPDLIPPILQDFHARNQAAQQLNQTQSAIDLLNRQYELINQYEAIRGSQVIEWDGESVPPRQLRRILREADRARRERAWRAIQQRNEEDQVAIHHIWSQLLDIRLRLAEINGFDDFLTYRWVELGRTDYSPLDSGALHNALVNHWSPLYGRVRESQRAALQLGSIRPWDIDVSMEQLLSQPFDTPDELYQKTRNVFNRMAPEFGEYIESLWDKGLIDLAERSHTSSVAGFSRAGGRHGNFILLNLEHTVEDVITFVHELGHALSIHASCQQPYLHFWGFPMDFGETPSTVMEMLSQPYWDEYFDDNDLRMVRETYFRNLVRWSLEDARSDAFQHWLYRNPDEARNLDACNEKWHQLTQQFIPGINWSGVESFNQINWTASIFMPLHAMEYFYGRLAGLKLLALPHDDAIARYKTAIVLGQSVSLKELFMTLGVEFPIKENEVQSVAEELAQRIF